MKIYGPGGKNSFKVAQFFFYNKLLVAFHPCVCLLVMAQAKRQQVGLWTIADVMPEG